MRATVLYDQTTCGVSVWHSFNFPNWETDEQHHFGGIGFAIAGFINKESSKRVYDEISKKHTIVYQSPVKENKNTDNEFFFVVFSKDKT